MDLSSLGVRGAVREQLEQVPEPVVDDRVAAHPSGQLQVLAGVTPGAFVLALQVAGADPVRPHLHGVLRRCGLRLTGDLHAGVVQAVVGHRQVGGLRLQEREEAGGVAGRGGPLLALARQAAVGEVVEVPVPVQVPAVGVGPAALPVLGDGLERGRPAVDGVVRDGRVARHPVDGADDEGLGPGSGRQEEASTGERPARDEAYHRVPSATAAVLHRPSVYRRRRVAYTRVPHGTPGCTGPGGPGGTRRSV